jgi:hypothetical protein
MDWLIGYGACFAVVILRFGTLKKTPGTTRSSNEHFCSKASRIKKQWKSGEPNY